MFTEDAARAIPAILDLKKERDALLRDRWTVWEGDESEGRWRCLMCGEKREGEDDTGPEGIEHHSLCGEAGQPIWAYQRMMKLSRNSCGLDGCLWLR